MTQVAELKSATQLAEELDGKNKQEDGGAADPKDSKQYTFEFVHRDARGQTWSGRFTNRILTVGQRRKVKILKAQLSGQVAVASLDADVWELNEIIAHLTYSLDRQADGFPEWARDLEALLDDQIIVKLYEEVASHEATFHRRIPAPVASEGADGKRAG